MMKTLGLILLFLATGMGSASAAKVAPVFTNDTSAHSLSFNDTFGHDVVMGSYNPGTGAWMPVGGGGGGAGSFTSLTVSGNATIGGTLGVTGLTTVGPLTATGVLSGVGFTNLFASPPPIGNTTPNTGAFTALSASGTVSGAGFSAYLAAPPAIGSTTPSSGAFTSLSASGTVSGAGFSAYFASPPPIGNTAPSTGAFTTLSASGAISGAAFTSLISAPPVGVGSVTPASGAFTTLSASGATSLAALSASGAVTGTGFSNLFRSPPPIGSTAPATGAFTSLSASGAVSGAGFTNLFASPPAIGNTAPSTGAFTTLSATGAISGAGFTSLISAPPVGVGSVTPASGAFTTLSATGATSLAALSASGAVTGAGFTNLFASPPPIGNTTPNTGAFTALSASGTVSGAGFSAYLAAPPAIGGTAANSGKFTTLTESTQPAATDNSTNVASTAWYASLNNLRTFQSFGAAGNGTTDDTAAVQTALNSGSPISCNGTFKITGLVTITTKSFQIFGGGSHEGTCEFLLSGSSAMFYGASLTGGTFASNQVVLKDIKITVTQAITAATGPAQTAAFYLTYPAGITGAIPPTLEVENVRIQGDAAGHYIKYGFALNEFQGARFHQLYYEGNRSLIPTDGTNFAILLNSSHSGTTVTVNNSFVDEAGGLLYAPAATSSGWQGIRVHDTDCVYCWIGVYANGSSDGSSDYLEVSGLEGAFEGGGIDGANVSHALLHHNYIFLVNGVTPGNPFCISASWSVATTNTHQVEDMIDHNVCDGDQLTTYTGSKFGIIISGTGNANAAFNIGPNILSSLDTGVNTQANTSGVTVYKQQTKNVTTEWLNAAAAGNITPVTPLARVDGSTGAAGQVGEVLRSTVNPGGVSLVSTVAKDVTTLALSAGHWSCYGNVGFFLAGTTTLQAISAGISSTLNTLPGAVPWSFADLTASFVTGANQYVPLNTITEDLTASTTLHLVADASFGVSTLSAFGFIECQRTM
jgi:hypothetical protein